MRDALSKTLQCLATRDRRVVYVGCDLQHKTMAEFKDAFPERFFMEGVAEQYVAGMVAGLASGGLIPYVEFNAAFITRRAFEQLFVDIGLERLRVRIIGSAAGLGPSELGPTHTALEDVALMRQVPNMAILIPRTSEELAGLLFSAVEWDGPLYIRLRTVVPERPRGPIGQIGCACLLRPGEGTLIVSTGLVSSAICEVQELLVQGGLNPEVLHFGTLRPFDSVSLCDSARRAGRIVVIEEHHRDGGLGTIVLETLADEKILRPTARIGTRVDPTLSYGNSLEASVNFGLRGPALADAILAACASVSHPS